MSPRSSPSMAFLIGEMCPFWSADGPHGLTAIPQFKPRRRGVRLLASLSRSDRLAKSLDRRRPSAEAWKRASEVPVTVKRLQGALCRITEARAAPEPGSGTLCLDASYGEPRAGPGIYLA